MAVLKGDEVRLAKREICTKSPVSDGHVSHQLCLIETVFHNQRCSSPNPTSGSISEQDRTRGVGQDLTPNNRCLARGESTFEVPRSGYVAEEH